MFEPEKTLTFFFSKNLKKKIIPKTSTLFENICENDWKWLAVAFNNLTLACIYLKQLNSKYKT